MPRETKKQRAYREAYENSARLEAECSNYLPRLMLAVEAALQNGFVLDIKGGKFFVYNASRWATNHHSFTAEYSEDNQDALLSLEWDVKCVAEEIAEDNRKFMVKQEALAKLTKEERELLGF